MQTAPTQEQVANVQALEYLSNLPSHFTDRFTDISSTIKKVNVHPSFANNLDLKREIKGWPALTDTKDIALFSIPPPHPQDQSIVTNKQTSDVEKQVHIGMGRGLSRVDVVNPEKSPETNIFKPGMVGVYDPDTGYYYSIVGAKGNGPTANEMLRVRQELGGSQKRREKKESWGILWEPTVNLIEQPFLDTLASIGFRVGRVPAYLTLDKKLLQDRIDPHYKTAGLDHVYDIRYELSKAKHSWDPVIMLRLAGGVRADVFANKDADPMLAYEGVYGLTSEIDKRGMDKFLDYYRMPEEMKPTIEKLRGWDLGVPFTKEIVTSYLETLSFVTWRNYHMQDEYNKRFSLSKEKLIQLFGGNAQNYTDTNIGPIWLNYKPGDWDVGGFFFDVDVFRGKAQLALEIGSENVRKIDRDGLTGGLSLIGNKLSSICGSAWVDAVERGRVLAENVTKNVGFLSTDVTEKKFY